MSLFAPIGRPRVMGIVNVTPDSFSDGGHFLAADAAVEHGQRLLAEGADLLDIGGESTRPGATRPLLEEELSRVVPVIKELASADVVVSVDTMRVEVARAALDAGARIVNDVSGGLADPRILDVVAEHEAVFIAMHWRAHGDRMQRADLLEYSDGVVATVISELRERIDACLAAGIAEDSIVLDPGLGFSKSAAQNWELIARIGDFVDLGHPVLVGASRKTFLGRTLAKRVDGLEDEPDRPALRPVDQREGAHAAINTVLTQQGVWCTRVHEVRAARDAIAAAQRMVEAAEATGGAR